MDYLEAIQYRKELRQKAIDRERLLPEEREWLLTNPIYNSIYGYPVLGMDIIEIDPKTEYIVTVTLNANSTQTRMSPKISIPLKKGYIITEFPVADLYGNVKANTPIKVFCTGIDFDYPKCQFDLLSQIGQMSIEYEGDRLDKFGHIHRVSSGNYLGLAMKRTDLSDHKIQYSCKGFTDDEFDKYIFTVEWERKK